MLLTILLVAFSLIHRKIKPFQGSIMLPFLALSIFLSVYISNIFVIATISKPLSRDYLIFSRINDHGIYHFINKEKKPRNLYQYIRQKLFDLNPIKFNDSGSFPSKLTFSKFDFIVIIDDSKLFHRNISLKNSYGISMINYNCIEKVSGFSISMIASAFIGSESDFLLRIHNEGNKINFTRYEYEEEILSSSLDRNNKQQLDTVSNHLSKSSLFISNLLKIDSKEIVIPSSITKIDFNKNSKDSTKHFCGIDSIDCLDNANKSLTLYINDLDIFSRRLVSGKFEKSELLESFSGKDSIDNVFDYLRTKEYIKDEVLEYIIASPNQTIEDLSNSSIVDKIFVSEGDLMCHGLVIIGLKLNLSYVARVRISSQGLFLTFHDPSKEINSSDMKMSKMNKLYNRVKERLENESKNNPGKVEINKILEIVSENMKNLGISKKEQESINAAINPLKQLIRTRKNQKKRKCKKNKKNKLDSIKMEMIKQDKDNKNKSNSPSVIPKQSKRNKNLKKRVKELGRITQAIKETRKIDPAIFKFFNKELGFRNLPIDALKNIKVKINKNQNPMESIILEDLDRNELENIGWEWEGSKKKF